MKTALKARIGVSRILMSLIPVFAGLGVVHSSLALQAPQASVDRYIVQLQPGADPDQTTARLAAAHGLDVEHVYRFALRGFSAFIPQARLDAVRSDPAVLRVEPDRRIQALDAVLPTGVDRIGADLNSTAKIDGIDQRVDVDIAILDTGIDLDHPDLNVYRSTDCARGGPFGRGCKDGEGGDGNGHGSHVAGTAAALDNGIGVVGVAPGARLWAVRVLDNSGSGWLSWLIAGMDWVTARAAEIEVANMSLGWQGTSESARTAIQNSVAKGVVYVVAAGNDGEDVYGPDGVFGTGDEYEPASYPEVAAISALADSDGQAGGTGASTSYGADDTLAAFSNFSTNAVGGNPVISPGAAIDMAGPGVSIYSTWKDGAYATASGTSMAAPHVTGAAALYVVGNGRADSASEVYAIRQALINAAEPQTSWGPADTKDPDNNREGLAALQNQEPKAHDMAITGISAAPTSATQGDTVTIEVTVANKGSNQDSADVTVTESPGGSHLGTQSVTLAAGGSQTLTFEWVTGGSTSTGSHELTAAAVMTSATDEDAANDSQSVSVTVSEPGGGGITLTATGYKVKGLQKADLEWSGAASSNVDVYRDGILIATTENDGFYTDPIDQRGGGSYTYAVCEAGTATCSNEASVSF